MCTGLAAGACDRPVQCFSSTVATAVPSSQHRRVDSPIYYYPPSQPSVRGLVRLSAARRRRRRSPPCQCTASIEAVDAVARWPAGLAG